jgi:hypothetical protein
MTTQAVQPLPMTPGATLEIYWDWTIDGWLEAGEAISLHTITVPTGVTLGTHSAASGVVTAWITLASDVPLYVELSIACQITTDHTPARTDTRVYRLLPSIR